MQKTLILTFNTEDNKGYRLTIKNPKDTLNKEQITPLAEKIVETQILNNSKRVLKDLKKVAYVTREEQIL